MSSELPPEVEELASLMEAQPESVQEVFRYCLAMAMVETGKARLLYTDPDKQGAMCIFQTLDGETFVLPKPVMSGEVEALMMEQLREILIDEGWLD